MFFSQLEEDWRFKPPVQSEEVGGTANADQPAEKIKTLECELD
jgi:hypothetical protein